MTIEQSPEATPLADAIASALATTSEFDIDRLVTSAPAGLRDRFLALLHIYDLHTAPLDRIGPAARFQHHPAIAAVKTRCEQDWLAELDQLPVASGNVVAEMRALAASDRLPAVYRWLAREADWPELVEFLALEGGPDAGFDDLVAACQIGLTGRAKLELATNYWDEMGNGDAGEVHTTLHDELVTAIHMPEVPVHDLPVSALARNALGGLLATNRWLQPEMLGALGLIELQAGPRCRLVLQALARCGASAEAMRFYEVHADVDPRHGNDWLHNVIAPIIAERPELGPRILRGATWRSAVNATFLDDVAARFGVGVGEPDEPAADAA
jgi:hypothetical protein